MPKNTAPSESEYYIGLMSGTSIDGIDAALVDFTQDIRLVETHFEKIPAELSESLHILCSPHFDQINRLGQADVALGLCFAKTVLALLNKAKITNKQVKAIGSHGQTIRHQPNMKPPFTLQIGDPNTIAELTGITTIADFRRRDMAVGGQGAPLVPAFHFDAFKHLSPCVIVNIGGMSNISIIPNQKLQNVSGFDTGPGNILLDTWIKKNKNQKFDQFGAWASRGSINQDLLSSLVKDDYFKKTPPKSTGREYFNLIWLEKYLDGHEMGADVQATLTELTAICITDAIKRYAPKTQCLILCGGGTHNEFLISRIKHHSFCEVFNSLDFNLDPDWIEAIAFAWLAKQTLNHQTGNLPPVTGAKKPVILGGVYYGTAANIV